MDTPMQDLRLQATFPVPLSINPAFWQKSKSKTYFFKSLTKNKRALYLLKKIGFTFTFLPYVARKGPILERGRQNEPWAAQSSTGVLAITFLPRFGSPK